MSEKYQVSSSPHVRAKDSTSRVMLYVIIALLPATCLVSGNFGMHALLLILSYHRKLSGFRMDF